VTVRKAAQLLAWVLLAIALPACVAGAQTVDTNTWITSGDVYAMARVGDTLYVGGNFLRVGPSTGSFVPVDSLTAAAVAPYPKVHGVLHSVVSDGSGGWYLGGNFDRVGGVARRNLAHVLAGGTVGTDLPSPDGTVNVLVRQGRTLFLGGDFRSIGATTRRGLGAVDLASASIVQWNPDASGSVNAMTLSGTAMYVGGAFDSLGGAARACVGVVDGVSGALGAWNPGCSYSMGSRVVRALAVSGSLVYVGGAFDQVDGVARNGIAAVDATTGVPTAWDAGLEGTTASVYSLLVDGPLVYVGGKYVRIGAADRSSLAAIDATTGLATAWDPLVDGTVYTMTRAGGVLYVGGSFSNTGSGPRENVAVFDLATGLARAWSPNAMGIVYDIEPQGSSVYLAGTFPSVGCLKRMLLAAFDLNTGMATSWDPAADGVVYSMLATPNGTLMIGGAFTTVGGAYRNALAEVDRVTGLATGWDAAIGGTYGSRWVFSLALSGRNLYVGGQFTSIGGQNRKNLAMLESDTGMATAWDPQCSGSVVALAMGSGQLYAGGSFLKVGGVAHPYLAAIDTATGLATAWNPAPSSFVRTIAVHGGLVYAGGQFTSIGGQSRSRIAAIDPTTGLATAWDPQMGGGSGNHEGVRALLPVGDVIVAGGDFDSIGAAVRHDIAALDVSTGLATAWDPRAGDPTRTSAPVVRTLLLHGDRVLAGGDFMTMADELRMGFASIQGPALPPVGWANLQWPPTLATAAGVASDLVYGQVWMSGVTDSPGAGVGIEAQLGHGPHGTLPATDPSWTWVPTTYNVDVGNNDEYMARLTIGTAGTYDYAFRYRYLWGPWLYGDLDGSGNGYSTGQAGVITVSATPLITGSILQWPPSVSITLGAATPTIYGRVWGAGITDGAGAATGLSAQLGYGPDGTDPATSGAWTWVSTAYNVEVDGGGEEYMATLTPAAAGTFDYAYRFSYLGGAWTYSDLDGSANGYQIAQAGALDVASAGVEEAAPRTLTFALIGANPVRHDASFRLGLPSTSAVTLDVFDAAGRQVARVAPGALPAGWHTLRWASAEAAPGMYVVRLRAAGEQRVTRLVVLR
jgi:trimeric autotransporter adhesin